MAEVATLEEEVPAASEEPVAVEQEGNDAEGAMAA
jgi:hypothetical protein